MRVTDSLMYATASLETARARARLEEAQRAASSGARVVSPGDDPAAAGQIASFQMTQQRYTAISSATALASSEIDASDAALNDVTNELSRVRQVAMQFASAGYTAEQRSMAGDEVQSIMAQIVADLNARFGNRYLFGGTQDGAPPFDAAGNYAGDDQVRQVEIAPGVLQASSVRADVAVKGAGGGVDLFASLNALYTALKNDDQAGVTATLGDLDTATNQVSAARAEIGNAMHAFDTATAATKLIASDAKVNAGKLGDVDVIQSSIDLQQAQTALQAALSATAQSIHLSILDYLR